MVVVRTPAAPSGSQFWATVRSASGSLIISGSSRQVLVPSALAGA